jgi:hypothetical protein
VAQVRSSSGGLRAAGAASNPRRDGVADFALSLSLSLHCTVLHCSAASHRITALHCTALLLSMGVCDRMI